MTTSELLRIGPDRLRLDHWNDDRRTVVVRTAGLAEPPRVESLVEAIGVLEARGIDCVTTPALDEAAQAPYRAAGFAVREHLHLLRHDLRNVPPRRSTTLRRARGRRDLARAAEVDHLAFPPAWWLDAGGIRRATDATPHARLRLTDRCAYAVSGVAATSGYLQRVAVAPDAQRQGIGSALVIDGLRWMRRCAATHAMVNTQEGNHAALALYVGLGFVPMPSRLAVLEHRRATPAVRH
jgi:ribosomal protein S18 acetylase RimI-like enzyme